MLLLPSGVNFIPPVTNGFLTNIDATFAQWVFYIAKRKRKTDIHHHSKTNDLG